jgi:type I restriction enzyme S subunit
MSKIDELIQQLCPNGIEYKNLGNICKILTGGDTPNDYIKGQLSPSYDYPYPIYSNGKDTYGYAKTYRIDKDAVTISSIGNVGFVSFRNAYFTPIIRLKVLIPFSELLNTKYLYYALSMVNFVGTNSSLSSMKADDVKKYIIPIPPLEIQEEIVRILDNFSKLETELETELEARNKQYEHYREKLLSFEGKDVEWKTLGEVCISITAGGDLPRKYIKNQKIPSIEFPYPIFANSTESKGLYGFTDNYTIASCAVTIAARGAKVGFHLVREPYFTPIVRLIVLIPNLSLINTKYLNFALDITPISGTKGAIPQLIVPAVKTIMIPIPTLSEQQRIVEILEKFDSLVNDISIGLPAEIQARRKQYEYYREKLLSFKGINNV